MPLITLFILIASFFIEQVSRYMKNYNYKNIHIEYTHQAPKKSFAPV